MCFDLRCPQLARVVVEGIADQVTRRGRRQKAFFSKRYPDAYCYDPNGNRIALRKRSQGTAALTCPAGAGVATGAVSIAYAYDVLSRQTQKTFLAAGAANVAYAYDLAGRPLSALFANQAGTPGVTWSYDAAGRRIAEATNGRTLGFAWDAAGNPQSFTWPDGAQATYAADAADRLTSIGAGGVSVAPGYDGLGRMTSVARGGTSTTIGFDPVDRVATLTHAFATTTANIAYTFGYTPASQVASAATSNTAYDWAGTSASTTSTTADGLNRDATIAAVGAPCAASGAGYDCNGNLTFDGVRTFTYDGENRLLTESGPVSLSLAYDPLGRLQQEVVNGAVTQFLYDGGALVAEYDGAGNLLRRYVHGPNADNPLIWFEGAAVAAANASFLIADRQGSIIASANSAGAQTSLYAYDPYGGPTAWGGSRFRYTGQIEIPEAQLYYYKARVYDPASGRFLQTDPVGYKDSLNLYEFVRNDPEDGSDPSGLETFQMGIEVEFGVMSKEWGNYKDQNRNDPLTFQYPKATGRYLTTSTGFGIAAGISVNITYCKSCNEDDLRGRSTGNQVEIGPITLGTGRTSGKPTVIPTDTVCDSRGIPRRREAGFDGRTGGVRHDSDIASTGL